MKGGYPVGSFADFVTVYSQTKGRSLMWSFIDFLLTEAREREVRELFLFYGGVVGLVFLFFFLLFMLG